MGQSQEQDMLQQTASDVPPEDLIAKLDRWRPYLLRIAIDELDSRLRPKVAASDLVQQTLLQAHQHASENVS